MAIVRINAIEVPEGMGERLEGAFAQRLGAVDNEPGFLGFQLLRPTGDNESRYFVVTQWESVEDFDRWRSSDNFSQGHQGDRSGPAVASGSALLEFDVVLGSSGQS